MKRFLFTLLFLILLLIGGIFALLYTGVYNIAATEEHTLPEQWLLETAKRGSVERRAEEIEIPGLTDSEMVLRGAGSYAAMCATCHGAPGAERSAMGRGLNPIAPAPDEMVQAWSAEEMFWITKNGIRMTGMPAWGESHSDEQIWEIVAFLHEMDEMTPEEYQAIIAEAPDHDHDHNHTGEPDDAENRHQHEH